jgi:hypothetical protein
MIKIEGYWYSKYEPKYPSPVANDEPWEGKAEFLEKLTQKESRTPVDRYKGWSNCRLCNKNNGSTEFKTSNWRWPEGYKHYIEDHNVKPSDEFYQFIMGNAR